MKRDAKVIKQEDEKLPNRGGILKALRASPLVGGDLDLARLVALERGIDL